MSRTSSISSSSSSSQEDLTIAPERPATPRPQTPLAEETAADLTLNEINARFALEKEQRGEIKHFPQKKHEGLLFAKVAEENRLTEQKKKDEEAKQAEQEKQAKLNASKFAFAGKQGSEAREEKTSQGCKCTVM